MERSERIKLIKKEYAKKLAELLEKLENEKREDEKEKINLEIKILKKNFGRKLFKERLEETFENKVKRA